MISSDLGTFFALLILGLVAAFSYYRGFITLLTRRVDSGTGRVARGRLAIALGLLQLIGGAVASGIAFLFYFSLLK